MIHVGKNWEKEKIHNEKTMINITSSSKKVAQSADSHFSESRESNSFSQHNLSSEFGATDGAYLLKT